MSKRTHPGSNRVSKKTKRSRQNWLPRRYRNLVPMGFAPLGNSRAATLKYHFQHTMNPNQGQVDDVVVRANDLYDPEVALGGHQPYGFDQLMTFYDHFTVLGSRITMSAFNSNGSLPVYIFIGLRDNNVSLYEEPVGDIHEQARTVKKLLTTNPSSKGAMELSMNFSAEKFFAKPKVAIVGDSLFRGDAGNSPLEQAYFHCMVGPYDTGNDLAPMVVNIEIEYYAIFTEPKILAKS